MSTQGVSAQGGSTCRMSAQGVCVWGLSAQVGVGKYFVYCEIEMCPMLHSAVINFDTRICRKWICIC